MNVIILLIAASLFVALVFLAGFIWATRSGQYDDTCTPPLRILIEDEPEPPGGIQRAEDPAPNRK